MSTRGSSSKRVGTSRSATIHLSRNIILASLQVRGILIRERANTIVVIHAGFFALVGALTKKLMPRVSLVLYAGGSDVLGTLGKGLRGMVARALRIWSFRQSDLVLTNGAHLKEAVIDIWRDANVYDVPHGIKTPNLKMKSCDYSALRIFAPRPWTEPYNNEQLLSAIEALPPEFHSKVSVTANVHGISKREMARLQKMAKTIPICMLDGYDFDDRYRYFSSACVVVSMSRSDGIPNAVLEAAYAGCTLILGDINATRDLVLRYELKAHLVEIDAPIKLARKLQELVIGHDIVHADILHNRGVIYRSFGSSKASQNISVHLNRVSHRNGKF